MHEVYLLLFLCLSLASSDPQNLICVSVDSSERQTPFSRSNYQLNRGPPGLTGRPGIRGRIGLPGRRGVVNYERIDDVIDAKIALALVKVRNQIDGWTGNWTGTKSVAGCEEGGLFHNGTCYTIRKLKSRNLMNYREALEECSRSGGSLAEIHDRNHQTIIRNFIHSKIPTNSSVIEVRIGMKFVKKTSTIRYRSGKEIPINQLQWWGDGNDYPIGADGTFIYSILISENGREGIWNSGTLTHTSGALCERSI